MSNISGPIGAACLALVLVLAACGDDDSSDAVASGADTEVGADALEEAAGDSDAAAPATPAIIAAWSRQPAVGQSVAAVFGEIVNPTDTELVLIGVSSPVTARVELHETTTEEGGMMTMGERDEGFVIAPGESLMLEPGGAHVMMLDIDASTYPAEVEVTFEFADRDSITVMATVQPINDGSAASDDAMDHDSSDAADDPGDGREAGGPLVIDVGPLHGIDDELTTGDLAPRRQRAIVAEYVARIEGFDPATGTPEAELMALLVDLDAALADRDLATAVTIAGEAHDLAHAIDDGTAN